LCKGSDGWRDKAGVAMAKIAIAMIAQEQEAPALHSATAAALCSLSSSRGQTRSPNLGSLFGSVQRGRISRKEKNTNININTNTVRGNNTTNTQWVYH
jgi:hypothetical protein